MDKAFIGNCVYCQLWENNFFICQVFLDVNIYGKMIV